LLVQNSGLSDHQLAADAAVLRLNIGRNDPDAICHEVRSQREPNATHLDTRQPARRFERDLCPPFRCKCDGRRRFRNSDEPDDGD
jgi:hypothetical protein